MTCIPDESEFSALTARLRELANPDAVDGWPTEHLRILWQAGAARWVIPREFGGDGIEAGTLLWRYRELARASLLTAFIFSQRNAACQRIESSANRHIAKRLLPDLASGHIQATVGISHLTTSRQHWQVPTVTATLDGTDYLLNGVVPWATGAGSADLMVTGGTLSDGRQLLAAVPVKSPAVVVRPAIAMLGLSASCTGEVELHDVRVPASDVLHGPVERVMAAGGGGAGSLSTSAIAIGTAQGTLDRFAEEAKRRPELNQYLKPLQQEADVLAQSLAAAALAMAGPSQEDRVSPETLRQRANSLVIRAAQAWLAATRGAGYVSGHPAERAVRESLFFLVWSCPQAVLDASLKELSCGLW